MPALPGCSEPGGGPLSFAGLAGVPLAALFGEGRQGCMPALRRPRPSARQGRAPRRSWLISPGAPRHLLQPAALIKHIQGQAEVLAQGRATARSGRDHHGPQQRVGAPSGTVQHLQVGLGLALRGNMQGQDQPDRRFPHRCWVAGCHSRQRWGGRRGRTTRSCPAHRRDGSFSWLTPFPVGEFCDPDREGEIIVAPRETPKKGG